MAKPNWLRIGVLIAGGFYLLLPHTMHLQSKLDFGLADNLHRLLGGILGGILLAFGLFALKEE